MQKRLLHCLTVLLLVLGQTALLAHQADIDSHHEQSEDCVVCFLSHSLDATVTAPTPLIVLASPGNEQLFSIRNSPLSVLFYRARSRAPPALHA